MAQKAYIFDVNGILYKLSNVLGIDGEWRLFERSNETDPWVYTSNLELEYFAIALKNAILDS